MESGTVDLLWLEPAPPGSAARTHLDGTLARLSYCSVRVGQVTMVEDPGDSVLGKFKRMWTLSRRARLDGKSEVLICRWHPLLPLATIGWRRSGKRVLLLVQGNSQTAFEAYPWFKRIPGSRWLIAKSLSQCDGALVLNEALGTWVRSRVPREVSEHVGILPTGVSDVFLARPSPRSDLGTYALFFGNFASWQGIDLLLAAHASALWPDGVNLVFVGSGEREVSVQQALSAERPPVWLGKLSPVDLASVVTGALCTISPKSETGAMAETTTPFKILESVAAGVPVVATNIPAQRRMIESGGYGLLTPTDDPAALARAVASIAENPALRDQLVSAANRHAGELSWSAHASILEREVHRLSGPSEERS